MIEIEKCNKCKEGKRMYAPCLNCFPSKPELQQRARLIYKEPIKCKYCDAVIEDKNKIKTGNRCFDCRTKQMKKEAHKKRYE